MPPVIAAVAAALIEIGISQVIATWVATFVVNAVVSYAISTLLTPSSNGYAATATARSHVIRSSIQPRNIIYGQIATSGPLIFVGSSNKGSEVNKYLHLVIALANHEVAEIGEIFLGTDSLGTLDSNGFPTAGTYLNNNKNASNQSFAIAATDTSVTLSETPASVISVTYPGNGDDGGTNTVNVPFTVKGAVVSFAALGWGATITVNYETNKYNALVRVKKHLGTVDQLADPDLIAAMPVQWTVNHRLQGVAYIYVRLEYDANVFTSGIPNIKAVVKGKKVYDPRTGVTAYSNNYALCVNDYLTSADGLGCTAGDIDVNSVIAAANISDELVQVSATGYQARYVCNGVVMSDKSPSDNLTQLSTAGGGPVPILAGGIFRINVGAYQIPSVTLTENDLRGPIKVRPRTSRRSLFNAVKGMYTDGAKTWLPVDFPLVHNELYASQDGGQIIQDTQLPFTTDGIMAQRLAKISLERGRQGITVEFPAKLSAFKLLAWDSVYLSIGKFGWTNKVFRVLEWKFNSNGGVDLVLGEESPNAYAWDMGMQTTIDAAPDTNLPDPSYVAPLTGLVLTSGDANVLKLQDGTIICRILATWDTSTDAMSSQGGRVEIEYKQAADATWTPAASTSSDAGSAFIAPVVEGDVYLVRIRLVSLRGAHSDWAYATHKATGKSVVPPGVIVIGNGDSTVTVGADKTITPSFDADGNIRITFDVIKDVAIAAWELRSGRSFESGVRVATTQGNYFTLPLLAAVGNQYWIRPLYVSGTYGAITYYASFVGSILPTITNLSMKVAEPMLSFSWDAMAGADHYLTYFEDGGITTVATVATPALSVPIPKYAANLRIYAISLKGGISQPYDQPIVITGAYHLNEVVNVNLPMNLGQYINMAFTNASQVEKVSLLGPSSFTVPVSSSNNAALYSFGYNLKDVAGSSLQNTPGAWFRQDFWYDGNGFFESAPVDLGAVLTGKMKLSISKTITPYGGAAGSGFAQVLGQYMANATGVDLTDQKAFLTATFYVCDTLLGPWVPINDGDWATACRYVKIVIQAERVSPLTDVLVTTGTLTLDVPDITETGVCTAVTSGGKGVTLQKPFHAVNLVLLTPKGNCKVWATAQSTNGFTINTDSATPVDVGYFVKGY